jgi:hypothetical protein
VRVDRGVVPSIWISTMESSVLTSARARGFQHDYKYRTRYETKQRATCVLRRDNETDDAYADRVEYQREYSEGRRDSERAEECVERLKSMRVPVVQRNYTLFPPIF